MITMDFEKSMYDKFIENEELTTKDLLSIGFTSRDLTRLKEKGKLESVRRGVYRLVDADGLFSYSRELVEKEEYERAGMALDRCLEISPDNGTIAANVFSVSIGSKNFDRAVKCIGILANTDNKFYENDINLWLLLLGYATELPEEYRQKNRKATLDNISVYELDDRYSDIELANKIREKVLSREFNVAARLLCETKEFEEEKFYAIVTFKLLNYAHRVYGNRRKLYAELISDNNYVKLVDVIGEDSKRWCLTKEEEYILTIANQMVSLEEEQVLPQVKGVTKFTFEEAIKKCNYRLAKEIYQRNFWVESDKKDCTVIHDKVLEMMLNKINDRIDEMKITKAAKDVGADEFSKITAALMNHDVDKAFKTMEQYLVQIDRYSYRKYVASLIKLSLLDKDMSFTEPMLALSRLSRNDYQFDVAVYIQDFYFNLTNGNLKRAAVFLDIISCSKDVGGIPIDTTDMREALINEMKNKGMHEEALAISLPKAKVVEEPVIQKKRVSKDELASEYCMLADVVDKVLRDDNVAMLEPMSEEDTEKVMKILSRVKDVDSFIINSTDGKSRHIVLKYCGRIKEFIDRGEAIRKAKRAYSIKNYEDCISLYESILPITKRPRSFIYSQLGMSYYETAKDTDFADAIDYLTLANAACREEKSKYGFSDLVERLKVRSGYNGIKINCSNSKSSNTNSNSNAVQYVKKDENNQERITW